MSPCIMLVLLSIPSFQGQPAGSGHREKIGETLGRPVYRDEIHVGKGVSLADELHRLFSAPVAEKYFEPHLKEIRPTEKEIDAVAGYFREQFQEEMKDEGPGLREQLRQVEKKLAGEELTEKARQDLKEKRLLLQTLLEPPDDRFFAKWMLTNWKFQRYLYDHYGGGRILWQQAGLGAFDAMHQWLLAREKAGDFQITDPKLRAAFYEYWTTRDHGASLFEDPERIRREFLEPEWMAGRTTR